ncbi:cysteine--tRNA ligase [Aeromicrobium wangtongii]|uniref:Cysteine--tRNA ligase n=1 Tax=Aeromicrobium wangtongii TaxID=2969247 RepID=A0ABY5M7T0_9ACTN|nr:cysteine--tRNA ligase [Aeromicrobium wangtongii]MCD9196700.1 cysteine--tRNA ligase [Aeromicrobium wangtongii]UUP14210.1 cysteine--tRNA ligase [Aeromicrobium wangtongii]
MAFHLYDTASRQIRALDPVVPGRVSIYHCGLTVQGPPHIGHIRKEVVFDVLRRWLERSGLEVSIVANVTDIDDKILAKAVEQGRPWFAVAYENERALHAAYEVLGCVPPTYEPRATGVVPEMIEMMQTLIERGHAYAADDGSGDVYFDVRSWPAYGELSNQKVDDMLPAEDAPLEGKRDGRDFALWKGHKDGDPESASWATPWGRGRPGWHLECSAMAAKYLGREFDIHGGGLDLRFPHHENELAQSRAAGQPFARYWMHNAMLNLAGAKMSKSVGNTLMVSEVVKRVRPIDLRYYLAASHYRSIVEFSEESLAEAATAFQRIEGFVKRAAALVGSGEVGDVPEAFAAAMDDDLSVPAAVAVLQGRISDGNSLLAGGASGELGAVLAQVRGMLDVLGLDPLSSTWDRGGDDAAYAQVIDTLVEGLLEQRQEARAAKDFANADRVRDQLTAAGIDIEDTPQGARWSVKGS